MNVYDWDLKQFFEELFNYCFPINYWMKQCEQLQKCYQNSKTILEFIYELEEIINMIGLIDEHKKVIWLWDGLWPVIKKGLWWDRYNPEVSTWDEVKHTAQIIELSEEVPGDSLWEWWSNPDHNAYLSGLVSFGGRQGSRTSYHNPWSRFSHSGSKPNYPPNGYHRGNINSSTCNNSNQDGSGKQRNNAHSSNVCPNGNKGTDSYWHNNDQTTSGHVASKYNPEHRETRLWNKQLKPQLSPKEQNEYHATRRCFNGGETGHMFWNCTSAMSMLSNHWDRPPGLLAHNVNVGIDNYEHVSGLDEVTETIDEIPVESMHLASHSIRSNSGGVHQPQQTCIDDFVAEQAMYILEQMRPYPKDGPLFEVEECHFMMYQFEPDLYVIMDQEICKDEHVSMSLLLETSFNLLLWYAEKWASWHNDTLPSNNWWMMGPLMGDPIWWRLMQTILEGMPEYPPYDVSDEHWKVLPTSFGYTIGDHATGVIVSLIHEKLEDRSFDLITWYANQCWERYDSIGRNPHPVRDVWGHAVAQLLNDLQPYPGDNDTEQRDDQFEV